MLRVVALDRPLTAKQMAELRAISTRAEISPTRFWNEYEWGDLKASPAKLLERYFDAHLYFANWGTHRLILRLAKARVDAKALEPYFGVGHAARLTAVGEHLLLDLGSDTEEPEDDEQHHGALAALCPLRAELMRGDLRPAYLAWLLAIDGTNIDDDVEEPRVPAGLAELTGAQEAMVEFLRIDVDLIAAAAGRSAAVADDGGPFRQWLAALSEKQKTAWLRRAADEPDLALGGELLRTFRAIANGDDAGARRTVGELRALAGARRAARERAEMARANKARAAADAARQRRLTALARQVERAWAKLEKLVGDEARRRGHDARGRPARARDARWCGRRLRQPLRGDAQASRPTPRVLRSMEAREQRRVENVASTMTSMKQQARTEWVGSLISRPAYVTGEASRIVPSCFG